MSPIVNLAQNSEIKIEVSNTQAHLIIDADWIAWLVRRTLAAEKMTQASISVAIMDDAAIRVINHRHLLHDWATDVISFRLDDGNDEELLGELVVSAEMAANMARKIGNRPLDELALYLVHGLLHLCGFDDQTPEEVVTMRLREAAVLGELGIVVATVDPAVTLDDRDWERASWPR